MPKKFLSHYIVFIPDEGCFGVTKSIGAHASLVNYHIDGIEHDVFILNEELVFIENVNMSVEEED